MHGLLFTSQAAAVQPDVDGFGLGLVVSRLDALVVDQPPDLDVGIGVDVESIQVLLTRAFEIVADLGQRRIRPLAVEAPIKRLAFAFLRRCGAPIDARPRSVAGQRKLFGIFGPLLLGRPVLQVGNAGVFETRSRVVMMMSGCHGDPLVVVQPVAYPLTRTH